MSSVRKTVLIALGSLSAVGIIAQLMLGQLILGGNVRLVKIHQHSGYTTVVLSVIYIMFSLMTIMSLPTTKDR